MKSQTTFKVRVNMGEDFPSWESSIKTFVLNDEGAEVFAPQVMVQRSSFYCLYNAFFFLPRDKISTRCSIYFLDNFQMN